MSPLWTRVTGLGLVSALGVGCAHLADAIRAGRSGIVRGDDPAHPAYRAPLPPLQFDGTVRQHADQRLAERAIRSCRRGDPWIQAGVLAALEAWYDAGLDRDLAQSGRVALIAAGNNVTSTAGHDAAIRYSGREDYVLPRFAVSLMDSHLLSVVSEVLEICGPGVQIGAASASGNAALIAGCQLLDTGEADACLILACSGEPSTVERRALANTGALSWQRRSVPLSMDRDGFTLGEAAAAVVLERGGGEARDRIRVYGTIRGWARRLHASAGPEPCARTEAQVMRDALRAARITPDRVGYVNAHATGSRDGDAAELAALDELFAGSPMPPWVNATKSMTGHTLSAAGLVECVATLTQLDYGMLHPTVGLSAPMPTRLRHPQVRTGIAHDAIALSNGYGFGGFNTTLVLAGGAAS